MGGLVNALEAARELNCKFFTPSSMHRQKIIQDTIQRPTTMYGVNKVAGNYYVIIIIKSLALIRAVSVSQA